MVVYMVNRFERECEELKRKNYDSLMLLMIAQPTRKEPDKLKPYEPLLPHYGMKQPKEQKAETGEEMLKAFFDHA